MAERNLSKMSMVEMARWVVDWCHIIFVYPVVYFLLPGGRSGLLIVNSPLGVAADGR